MNSKNTLEAARNFVHGSKIAVRKPLDHTRCTMFLQKNGKRQVWVRPMGSCTQLCKLRNTWYLWYADLARLCYVPFVIWCLWNKSAIWLLILSSTSFMVGRSRVFHILLHERFRSVNPYVLPGWTGRFYKGDAVHNHSAHAYHIIRIEEGAIYAWYCCYMLRPDIMLLFLVVIHIFTEPSWYLVSNMIRFDQNCILWGLVGGTHVLWFCR